MAWQPLNTFCMGVGRWEALQTIVLLRAAWCLNLGLSLGLRAAGDADRDMLGAAIGEGFTILDCRTTYWDLKQLM